MCHPYIESTTALSDNTKNILGKKGMGCRDDDGL